MNLNRPKGLTALSLLMLSTLAACNSEVSNTESVDMDSSANIWPKINSEVKKDPKIEARISKLLSTMTVDQKVAQMIQPEIRDITVEDMREYGFGSYLNGGGAFPNNNKHSTPDDWIALAEAMYQASIDDSIDGSSIPTMWGTDAVHGHNNVIGATLFPHNIGLGAANNPELIEKIAKITATEVMVTGIDWVFAPTVATVRDDRWGRTYEGYSEDPDIVKAYASSIVKGLQGHADKDFLGDSRVISTVKHFIGDGGTEGGDDQGNNHSDEQTLFDIHAQGYMGGLTAGAQSVMASFNSWRGEKIHGSKYLLTEVLKNTMGFDGFVVGDWNGHGQIAGCSNESCPKAINAGLDIFMVPTAAWKPLLENTIKQVKSGAIDISRIDDAVSRILRVKLRAGLFEKPSPANRQFSGKVDLIGSSAHRDVAKQAVRESLVLLKNKNNILPLSPSLNVLVAGDGADNIGKQSGGWTITWQGTNNTNEDFPGGSSIYDGIKSQIQRSGGSVNLSEVGDYQQKPDVAIVIFGEEPYAEGQGDVDNLIYQSSTKEDLALLNKLRSDGIPVVSIFISGRPMWVNAELNASDAFVAAWLPGSEGAAIADVLFSDRDGKVQYDFSGKLSFSWPKYFDQVVNHNDEVYDPLLPYGFGLAYGDTNVLSDTLIEEYSKPKTESEGAFFDGKVIKPWFLQLFSAKETQNVVSNSADFESLSFRTVDKNVQEDAFAIKVTGKTKSGFRFVNSTAFSGDLYQRLEEYEFISLELKVVENFNANIQLLSSCGLVEGAITDCRYTADISEKIDNLPVNTWQSISIKKDCLSASSTVGSSLATPFELSITGHLELEVAKIKYEHSSNVIADSHTLINCL